MDILFGRDKKEQREPVRAKVTGGHSFQTYIHVIDRRTGKPVPTMFYTDPMVVFHHVNAYEEDGCLLFDVIAYEDSSLYQHFYLAKLNQLFEESSKVTSIPTLKRFAVPLCTDKNAEVGSNLIKLASTTARALKEKDDQVYCQPELLVEGKMHPLSLCLGKGNISDGMKRKSPLKHTEVLCSIASRSLLSPSYYHSFGITEHYVVFLEQPFKLDILKMATAYIRGVSWASCLTFHKEDKVDYRKYVTVNLATAHPHYDAAGNVLNMGTAIVDKGKTRYVIFKIPAAAPGEVHYRSRYLRSDTYNANIEANRIVVSEFGTMAYPDPCKNIFSKAFSYLSHTIPDFTDNCLINIMRCGEDFYATTETNYIRKINPQTLETLEKLEVDAILESTLEGPSCSQGRSMLPNKSFICFSSLDLQILKYDILTKSSLNWGEEHCWPGEPLFVPTPGARDEDDGIILSAIISSNPQKPPFLLILDAKSFTELARAYVDVEMHLDLHGLFIPDADLDSRKQVPSQEVQDKASDCHVASQT
ncbi:PREDICTED: beta,beta-carotene 15,15'-dioxygenase [Hipposideros armiger]|uniref:Beta,beta-carotene 15,15'-dioxygenase n=1 Tax=Hipposideros armiger TaxID=186990 RepID=A0A8B7QQ14_HIPAR|nr:PREDICTED: beta,beta-carotene 15,15'-dioxygenase [Hipposideros armiger]